jgi:hypothetical protein
MCEYGAYGISIGASENTLVEREVDDSDFVRYSRGIACPR